MADYDKSINTQKKAGNAMDRLAQVEQSVKGLLKLIDRELGALVNQFNQLSDVLNGTVKVVGLEKVQAVLVETANEKLAGEEAAIAEGQLEGKIQPVNVVPPVGIVGYKEFDNKGQLRIPGKYFKNVQQLGQDAQNLLIGKEVGFKTDIGGGATMEVVEAYEILAPPPPVEEAPVTPVEANGAVAAEVPVASAPTTDA